MNTNDKLNVHDLIGGSLIMNHKIADKLEVHGHFKVECIRDGEIIWTEEFDNLVTTVGKNDILDKYLAGSTYTQTIRIGLKGVGTAVVGDTQASHGAWLEQGLANAPTYTGNRQVPTFGAAAAGVKATSANVVFPITSTGTVGGVFVNNGGSATKDDTSGVLFSAGDFAASRAVISGDTLNVTYSLAV